MKKFTELLEKDFTTEKIKQLSKDLRDISDEISSVRALVKKDNDSKFVEILNKCQKLVITAQSTFFDYYKQSKYF